MSKKLISLIVFVAILALIVIAVFKESGWNRREREWKAKYDSLNKILETENELRKKEQSLRKASEEKIITILDSVKQVRKVDSLLIVRQKALPAKYKKIIENATDKELLQKLDSAFMR